MRGLIHPLLQITWSHFGKSARCVFSHFDERHVLIIKVKEVASGHILANLNKAQKQLSGPLVVFCQLQPPCAVFVRLNRLCGLQILQGCITGGSYLTKCFRMEGCSSIIQGVPPTLPSLLCERSSVQPAVLLYEKRRKKTHTPRQASLNNAWPCISIALQQGLCSPGTTPPPTSFILLFSPPSFPPALSPRSSLLVAGRAFRQGHL